jgi:hypothetical protein
VIRVIVVLFWLSLLIGTLLAHNLVANWAVTLAGLYILARWWNHRGRERRAAKASVPTTRTNAGHGASESSAATPQPRSRWTVDGVHAHRSTLRLPVPPRT